MASICNIILYHIFLSFIFIEIVDTQGVFLQDPTDILGTRYRAEYSGGTYRMPMEDRYLNNYLIAEWGKGPSRAIRGNTNQQPHGLDQTDLRPQMEFHSLVYPGGSSAGGSSQYMTYSERVQHFPSDETSFMEETFTVDTIVAQQGNTNELCSVTPWGLRTSIGQGLRIGCMFNEVVICAKPREWISFGLDATGGQWQAAGWYRSVDNTYSQVTNWRYIKTRSQEVVVTLRFGKRSPTCLSCTENNCPPDKTLTNDDWNNEPEYGERPYRWYLSDIDISCMFMSYPTSVTCEVDTNLVHGKRLISHATYQYIAFPAQYEVSQFSIENAKHTKLSTYLSRRREIISCESGFYAATDEDGDIMRCFPQFDSVCAEKNEFSLVTDCSNAAIWSACSASEVLSNTEFEECFVRSVLLCQNYFHVDPTIGTLIDFNDPCSSVKDMCEYGHYYDLGNLACVKCKGDSDLDSDLQKKWDTIGGISMKCEGSYPGRVTCKDTFYLQLTDSESRETDSSLCFGCTAIPREITQYIDSDVQCGSFWDLSDSYKLVPQPSQYRRCDNSCPRSKYIICDELASCKFCSCDNGPECDAYLNYCHVNETECNGRKFIDEGAYCRSRDDVTCPIGTHFEQLPQEPFRVLETYENIDSIISQNCIECLHPNSNSGSRCDTDQYWPGCTETGLKTNPGCTSCPTVNNSDWAGRSEECSFDCNEGYYVSAAGTECISCRVPCRIGEYRRSCYIGANELNSCTRSIVRGDNYEINNWGRRICKAGYFTQLTDGHGYCDAVGDNEPDPACHNTCEPCATTPAADDAPCGELQTFKVCDKFQISDTGVCVDCFGADVDTTNMITETGEGCRFECAKGSFSDNGGCTECSTDIEEICGCGEDCDGYDIQECEEIGRTEGAQCECKPGYVWRKEDGKVKFHICENFKIGIGGTIPDCYNCIIGYSGVDEKGSTECLACPVNTFRNTSVGGGCEQCNTGTDGLTGINACKPCNEGLRATIQTWRGYVRNYNTIGTATNWTYWEGLPPTVCKVDGMGSDIQICEYGTDHESISWRTDLTTVIRKKNGISDIVYEWKCESCTNGLAFSTNFNLD